jgi:hypothetical protein
LKVQIEFDLSNTDDRVKYNSYIHNEKHRLLTSKFNDYIYECNVKNIQVNTYGVLAMWKKLRKESGFENE